MKTATLFWWINRLLSLVFVLAVVDDARGQAISALPTTNTVVAGDRMILNKRTGASTFATRQIALSNIFDSPFTISQVQAISASNSYSVVSATNVPPHRYAQNWFKTPTRGWDAWNTFYTSYTTDGWDWETNYTMECLSWITNGVYHTKTNGFLAAGWDQFWITDLWSASNRVAGLMTWDTNMFPPPWTLPVTIDFAWTNGFKIMLYTSLRDTTCANRTGSDLTNTYSDVQTMMSWGASGVMVDTCDLTLANRDTLRSWARLCAQAIEDYHEVVMATGGLARPFLVQMTAGYNNSNPDQIDMEVALAVNTLNMNYNVGYSPTPATLADHSKQIFGSWRPIYEFGPRPWTMSAADMSPTTQTNLLNHFVMQTTPMRVALSLGRNKFVAGPPNIATDWKTHFTNKVANYDGFTRYWDGVDQNYSQIWTNREMLALHTDPFVQLGNIVHTNAGSLTELWRRPIGAVWGQEKTNVLCWMNYATTNYTWPLNVTNFAGQSNIAYELRDPWRFTSVRFTNQVDITCQASNAGTTLRVVYPVPVYAAGDGAAITNLTATNIAGGGVLGYWGVRELWLSGGGTLAASAATVDPWYHRDGWNQTSGNNDATLTFSVPTWARSVTLSFWLGHTTHDNVLWTNKPSVEWWFPTGRDIRSATSHAEVTNLVVTTSNKVATFHTHTIPLIWGSMTNAPKVVGYNFEKSTNTGTRAMIGPLYYTFQP